MSTLDIIYYTISYVSAGIIIYGVVIAIVKFVWNEISRKREGTKMDALMRLRIDFGHYLLLGLEFLIAADIIHTILEPSLEELYELGGIVIIRTILTVFLNKEIENGKR